MTTWTPFTLAVVTNAMPSDVGQLYTNWITAHPEKANRLAEIVAETRQAIRDAVSTNPRNIIDPATDTVPTVGFRHGLNMVFFSLGMEMGAQMGPDAHSQMLRADLWLRMVQTGGIPMAVDVGMRGGTPSYKAPGTGGRRMKHGVLCVAVAVVCLAGSSFAGWLNPAQPGFTADETLLRIAGDQAGVAALAGATDALWRVMGSHNHDGRYDPAGAAGGVSNALLQVIGAHNHDGRYDSAGAANAVCNTVLGAVAGEAAARAAFDGELQATNGLVLYGHDLHRETVVDGAPGWLDWRVRDLNGQNGVWVWAHWDGVILNSDGSVDGDQVPDFGAFDCGPFAWILDPDGNYRVPQVWQEGDHFANIGPDNAVACWWVGYWAPGETTVGEDVIDAVETGYTGSDYLGSYDENVECPVNWQVSEDGKQVGYQIDWQASSAAPPWAPWPLAASSLGADLRVRPAVDDAFVSDGGVRDWNGYVQGALYSADGNTFLGQLGYGAVDPPVEMTAGCFLPFPWHEEWPSVGGAVNCYLENSWFYGFERRRVWFQVPSAYEVTQTVNAAVGVAVGGLGATYYTRGEVDASVGALDAALGGATQTLNQVSNQVHGMRWGTMPADRVPDFSTGWTPQDVWSNSVSCTNGWYAVGPGSNVYAGNVTNPSTPLTNAIWLGNSSVYNADGKTLSLFSPTFFNVQTLSFSCRMWWPNTYGYNILYVCASTNGGLTWPVIWSEYCGYGAVKNVSIHVGIPGQVQFRFYPEAVFSVNQVAAGIGNIQVTYPPTQPPYTDIEDLGRMMQSARFGVAGTNNVTAIATNSITVQINGTWYAIPAAVVR